LEDMNRISELITVLDGRKACQQSLGDRLSLPKAKLKLVEYFILFDMFSEYIIDHACKDLVGNFQECNWSPIREAGDVSRLFQKLDYAVFPRFWYEFLHPE